MYCHACGSQIEDGSTFCPECGTKQAAAAQPQEQGQADGLQLAEYGVTAVAYQETPAQPILPEGQDLLGGLYTVRNYLQAISDRMDSFLNNEGQIARNNRILAQKPVRHVEQLKTVSVQDDPVERVWFAIAMMTSCWSVTCMPVLIVLMFLACFAHSKKKTKALVGVAVAGVASAAYLLISYANEIAAKTRLYSKWGLVDAEIDQVKFALVPVVTCCLLLGAIVGVISFLAAKRATNKFAATQNSAIDVQNQQAIEHNRKADEQNALLKTRKQQSAAQNQQLAAANQVLAQEAENLACEMRNMVGSWFPWGNEGEYYTQDVVDAFITIVQNHEADTVKEMMQVYKQDKYRVSVLSNQDQMRGQIDQALQNQQTMISNQQEMHRLQRQGNAIAKVNCMANMATAANTNAIKNSTEAIKNNTDAIRQDVNALKNKPSAVVYNDNRSYNPTVNVR